MEGKENGLKGGEMNNKKTYLNKITKLPFYKKTKI